MTLETSGAQTTGLMVKSSSTPPTGAAPPHLEGGQEFVVTYGVAGPVQTPLMGPVRKKS